ncbi:hypothetical protein BDK51DRAFT_40813 [Blyttiomyces helicus]|uniref:Uncharacterized protein n=1 Tax=Blyttiomyces helicus TaxID=388810 RepID=A0A4P9WEG7_9FUNG|nr:hypothetical protein BDK51DRAFT_40813 [Blyttiomyces helicus]|eukprot:RKO88786.1 hypothetical protein BDK51DRAFT_40813 [Blyttiomyces helicus]
MRTKATGRCRSRHYVSSVSRRISLRTPQFVRPLTLTSLSRLSPSVVGADTLFCVCSLYVMVSVRPEDQSVASGVFNTVLSIGTSVVLALTSAMAGAQTNSSGTPLESYRAAFWTCAGISGLGVLAAAVGADIGIVGATTTAARIVDVEEINVRGRL